MNTGTVVCAIVLSAVLPVSLATLYMLVVRHTQLAAESAMDSSVLARFDNVAELDAFHQDQQAAAEVRTARAMARYHQILLAGIEDMDPVRAKPYRERVMAAASSGASGTASTDAAATADCPDDTAASPADDAACAPAPSGRSRNGFGAWSRFARGTARSSSV